MTDPISDMLTRIRNANRALLPVVEVPHSKMKETIANILKKEGYVAEVTVAGKQLKTIKLQLKYQGKKSVIEGLRRNPREVWTLTGAERNRLRLMGAMGRLAPTALDRGLAPKR